MAIFKKFNFMLPFLVGLMKANSEGQASAFILDDIRIDLKTASLTSNVNVWTNVTSGRSGCLKLLSSKSNSNKCVAQHSKEVTIWGLTQNTPYYARLTKCNTHDKLQLATSHKGQPHGLFGSSCTQADVSPGWKSKPYQNGCNPIYLKLRPINWPTEVLCAYASLEHDPRSLNFTCFNSKFDPIITNGSCNIDWATQAPNVSVVCSDLTTIHLNVTLSYQKFKGPFNYQTGSIDDSGDCSTTGYQETLIEPLLTHLLHVRSLSPSCGYNISSRLSRSNDQNQDRFELRTAMDAVAGKVRDLKETSVGPNYVSFQWLPPYYTTNITEFYIFLKNVNTDVFEKNFSLSLVEAECRQSREYYCGNVTQNVGANNCYTLAVLPIRVNTLKNSAFKDQINNAIKLEKYSKITFCTKEECPQEPLDLRAFWSSPDTLKISWYLPSCPNDTVQLFIINVEMQYRENTTKLFKHSVNTTTDYQREYFSLFPVNIKTGLTLSTVKICVDIVTSSHSSKCVPKNLQIPPPKPEKSREKIILKEQLLLVPLTEKSDFKSKLFVYVSPFYNKSDLMLLNASLEFARASSEMPKPQNYCLAQELNTSREIKNRPYGTFRHMFKSGTKNFSIAIFRINIMNDQRSVLLETEFLDYHQDDSHIFGDETTMRDALWTVSALLLLIPALIYATYKYRRSLMFKIQCAMSHCYVADDFARGILDRSESELNCEVNYERHKASKHSRRVKVTQLASYVKDAIDSQELQRQHQLFPRAEALIAQDPAFTCTLGKLPENRIKNRYNNVLPFDHNLVTLPQTGYINANYIDGYNKRRAYIATQGPLPNTVDDFWRMIWENRVVSVVMMVNLCDGDKKNCEKYWPDFGQELDFKGIKVTLCADASHSTYNVREMRVCLDGDIRKVTQVQFTRWPPIGRPLFPQTLVSLTQKILTLPYTSRSPILVHCAAGVGRTGTIILCDVNLRMAAAENAVDFLGTLQRLREQRPNMVDNADQYKLAHLVVLASLTAWNTTIASNNMESAVERILEDGLVKRQFKYLIESEWQDDAMKTGISAAARYVRIISEKNSVPDESCQVFLDRFKDGYVNAIAVDGYRCPDKFIVAQHPLPTTLEDFWRLVAEQRCYFVVNLNCSDLTDKVFWPGVQAPLVFQGNLRVELLNSTSEQKLTVVKVRVCSELDSSKGCEKATLQVAILNYMGWPREAARPDNLHDFVSFLMDTLAMARKASPVIVTCSDGATASGLYVTLWNLVEQLQREKRCDVCQTVRTIRISRKQFVCTKEQLEEVYKGLLVYLRGFNEYMELCF